MSMIGSKGFYGVSTQIDRDLPTTDYTFFEATTAPFQVAENARARRPTIGDQPLPRNAYKVGVAVQSSLGLEVTPDTIGQMFYYATGQALRMANVWSVDIGTATGGTFTLSYDDDTGGGGAAIETAAIPAVSSAQKVAEALAAGANLTIHDVFVVGPAGGPWTVMTTKAHVAAALTASGTNLTGPDSPYTVTPATVAKTGHVFRMDPVDKYYTPYFSLVRGIGETGGLGSIEERAADCKIDVATVSFVAGDALQSAFRLMGRRPYRNDTGGGGYTPPTIAYDNGELMTVIGDDAYIELNLDGDIFGSTSGAAVDILAANLQWSNMLTPITRYKIGSKYPIDFTLLDRAAQVQLALEISDKDLYDRVYYSGADWNDVPILGTFQVRGSNTQGDQLILNGANVFFTGLLVANEPQRIVEATLTATLLKTAIGDAVQMVLVNGNAAGYDVVNADRDAIVSS